MQQEIEQLSVIESSRDGAVEVTIGSNGILQNLQLAENAGNRPMAELAAEITRAVQAARAKIPDLMRRTVADTVGLEDTAAQHVLTEARKNFPLPPEDEDAQQQRGSGVQEMQFGVEDDHEQPQRRQPPPQQRPTRRHPDLVDQLNVAVDASQVTMNNDACGTLCQPFALLLQPIEQHGVDTLRKSV
ncbi:YbaB/EbfC family nucleoid-associated protein [Saccharopolyspora sp. K220]|nr:YbaB/EbfC family nucleoid-associated protein [Saccharopolyspora soli]